MKKQMMFVVVFILVLVLSGCQSNTNESDRLNIQMNSDYNLLLTDNPQYAYFENAFIFTGVFTVDGTTKIESYIYDLEDDYFIHVGEYTCVADCETIAYVSLDGINDYLVIRVDNQYYFEALVEENGLGGLKVIEYNEDFTLSNLEEISDYTGIDDVLNHSVNQPLNTNVNYDLSAGETLLHLLTNGNYQYYLIQSEDGIYVKWIETTK